MNMLDGLIVETMGFAREVRKGNLHLRQHSPSGRGRAIYFPASCAIWRTTSWAKALAAGQDEFFPKRRSISVEKACPTRMARATAVSDQDLGTPLAAGRRQRADGQEIVGRQFARWNAVVSLILMVWEG